MVESSGAEICRCVIAWGKMQDLSAVRREVEVEPALFKFMIIAGKAIRSQEIGQSPTRALGRIGRQLNWGVTLAAVRSEVNHDQIKG